MDDNIEGEKETIPTLTEDDLQQLDEVQQNPGPFAATWRACITSASKGVSDKTDSEYLLRLRRISTNPQQSFVRRFGAKKSSNDKLLVYLSGLRMIIE